MNGLGERGSVLNMFELQRETDIPSRQLDSQIWMEFGGRNQGKWWASKHLTTGSLRGGGGIGGPVSNVCQLLWCKYFTMANF